MTKPDEDARLEALVTEIRECARMRGSDEAARSWREANKAEVNGLKLQLNETQSRSYTEGYTAGLKHRDAIAEELRQSQDASRKAMRQNELFEAQLKASRDQVARLEKELLYRRAGFVTTALPSSPVFQYPFPPASALAPSSNGTVKPEPPVTPPFVPKGGTNAKLRLKVTELEAEAARLAGHNGSLIAQCNDLKKANEELQAKVRSLNEQAGALLERNTKLEQLPGTIAKLERQAREAYERGRADATNPPPMDAKFMERLYRYDFAARKFIWVPDARIQVKF